MAQARQRRLHLRLVQTDKIIEQVFFVRRQAPAVAGDRAQIADIPAIIQPFLGVAEALHTGAEPPQLRADVGQQLVAVRAKVAQRRALDVTQQTRAIPVAIGRADLNDIGATARRDQFRGDIQPAAQIPQRLVLQVEYALGDAAMGDLEHVARARFRAQQKVAFQLGGQLLNGSRPDAVARFGDSPRFFRREGRADVVLHQWHLAAQSASLFLSFIISRRV